MTTKKSISQQVAGLRVGRSLTVKMDSSSARVTAWRSLGAGKYATSKVSKRSTKIKRLA